MDRGDTVENRSEKAKKRQRYKQGVRTTAGPCQTTAQDLGGDLSDGTEEQNVAVLPTPQQWLMTEKGQAGDEGGGADARLPLGMSCYLKPICLLQEIRKRWQPPAASVESQIFVVFST